MELTEGIYGLEALTLPEGWTPLEAVAIVKTLDEQGRVSLIIRSTDGLNLWESLGMLEAGTATTRQSLTAIFEDEYPDDEDDEDDE